MNTNGIEVSQQQGILESVKEKVNLSALVDRVHDSRGVIIDSMIYGGVGFIIGYLMKRYINAVITIILMTTILFVMQQFNIVSVIIHWEAIYDLFGITPIMKVLGDNIMPFIIEWGKTNIFLVVSWVVGFLVGIKMG